MNKKPGDRNLKYVKYAELQLKTAQKAFLLPKRKKRLKQMHNLHKNYRSQL